MKKTCSIVIIVILVASILIIAQPGYASATELSIPQFTAKYVDLTYNIPPTYGVDQYTGETVVKQGGYTVDNRSIQFTIKNQPFTSSMDQGGNQTRLYYNFRIKGAYGTEWDYFPFAPSGWSTRRYGGLFGGNSTESPEDLVQSNTEYTTITIQIPGVYRVPAKAQLEVQVQAIIGYMYPTDHMMAGYAFFFTGQYGEWSDTQALMIGVSDTIVSPTATPTAQFSLQIPAPTATVTSAPAENSTIVPQQPGTESSKVLGLGFSLEQFAIIALSLLVISLLIVIAVITKKGAHRENGQEANINYPIGFTSLKYRLCLEA